MPQNDPIEIEYLRASNYDERSMEDAVYSAVCHLQSYGHH